MNCRDINHLLDTSAAGELTQAQNDSVRKHLDSCHACSEEWAGLNELAASPVPATPAGLHQRILAALPAQSPVPRRPLVTFMLGGALLAGAALAATAAWQITNREPQRALAAADSVPVVAGVHRVQEVVSPVPVAVTVDAPPASAVVAPAIASNATLDPRTLVVVMRPEVAADAPAIALAERCHDATVNELRLLGGLNVITDPGVYKREPFPERMRLSERDQTIARSHGAGSVLVVTTEMGCDYALFNSQTREMVQGAGGGGVDPKGGREIDFGKGMAHMARVFLSGDGKTEIAGARATLLDGARSDRDRAQALGMLVEGRRAGPASPEELRAILDKDVVAVAIQLGTRSPDAKVRSATWNMLRGADDPAIVQALLQVIANDQDRSVRYQAINATRKFLDVPGVREALLRAAEQDTDSQPQVFCCMSTVRDLAERAAVPDSEFLAWARRKLLDETLPGRSRLINLMGSSSDGRFVGRLDRIGGDAAGVVFEIAQRDPDPRVRAMAWDALHFGQADREFVSRDVVPELLGDLRSSTNERVRAGAARILAGFKENAEVSEALQRARTDASIMVRRAVLGEGGGPVSAE